MRTALHIFDTALEGRGFRKGVEWVNDSAIEFDGEGELSHVRPDWEVNPGYAVVFLDQDGDEDEVFDHRKS